MVNTMFADEKEFLRHIISPTPLVGGRREELFHRFQESGYLALQEDTGITVAPKLAGGNLWNIALEGNSEANGRMNVVLLSHPSVTDEEFESWLNVVRDWYSALSIEGKAAVGRKIARLKDVEAGVSLDVLSKGMPSGLLISYRRSRDFVIVVESGLKGKRAIYTTKGIG
jgi:hypothetical protein